MLNLKVYVAGGWNERFTVVAPMMNALRAAGAVITCDWTRALPEVAGVADADMTSLQRERYAREDLTGVRDADLTWLCATNYKGARGSFVELGYALALRDTCALEFARLGIATPFKRRRVIVSGPTHRESIFSELADACFDSHAFALDYVLKHASAWRDEP